MGDELPLFDSADALERVGGDSALFAELLQMFKADYPKAAEALSAALHRKDLSRIEREAHGLAGSLVNLGAKRAAAAAQAISVAARDGLIDSCTARFRDLAQAVQGFIRAADQI